MSNNSNAGKDFEVNCGSFNFYFSLEGVYLYNFYINVSGFLITSFLIIVLNCLILVTLLSNNIFNTPSFTLLKFKSLVNVTQGFLTGPLWLTTVFLAKSNAINCTIYMVTAFTGCVNGGNLVLLVILISIDRYVAVFMPFSYIKFMSTHEKFYIYVYIPCFLITFSIGVISITVGNFTIVLINQVVYCMLLLLLTPIIYWRLYFKVKRIRLTQIRGSRFNFRDLQSEYKKTLLTFMLVVTLYLAYIPFLVAATLRMMQVFERKVFYGLYLWVHFMIYSYSFIAPLLYCCSLPVIRRKIRQKFKCTKNKINMSNNQTRNNLKNRRVKLVQVIQCIHARSSVWKVKTQHPQVNARKCSVRRWMYFKSFAKFTGKHLFWSLFSNKVAALQHATLLQKRKRDSDAGLFL